MVALQHDSNYCIYRAFIVVLYNTHQTYFSSGSCSMLYLQTKSNLSPDILHVSREQMHFRKETCITHILQVKKNLDLGSS